MSMLSKIKRAKELMANAAPLPWEFQGNIPFSISMQKPRPSLSSADTPNNNLWHYDDGLYAAYAINFMPQLIEYVEQLEQELQERR